MTEHRNHWHPPAKTSRLSLRERLKAHAKANPNDKNPTVNAARGEEE
jgi:hypothetical protein